MVTVAFVLYFLALSILEVISALKSLLISIIHEKWLLGIPEGGSLINAFVLATIAATYLKGILVKRESYPMVASLIAVAFSVLMFLAYLASGSFSFAIFGIVAFPYLRKLKKVKG